MSISERIHNSFCSFFHLTENLIIKTHAKHRKNEKKTHTKQMYNKKTNVILFVGDHKKWTNIERKIST